MVFLDCGNLERNPAAEAFALPGARILNIDHHHDNTRFGTANWSTRGVMHGRDRLGADARARRRADADDRGGTVRRPDHRHRHFMYENTGAAGAHDGGRADRGGRRRPRDLSQVYEGVPYGEAALLARGLTKVERFETAAHGHFPERRGVHRGRCRGELLGGRDRPPAAVEGTAVAALIRDRGAPARQRRRQSGRCRCVPATPAWTCRDRTGARGAAATVRRPGSRPSWGSRSWWSSCAARSRRSCCVQRTLTGSCLRQAGRDQLARCRRPGTPLARARRQGRARRDTRSVRDRAAARARRPCDARAAVADGAAEDATWRWRGSAVSSTGDPEGEIDRTGRRAERATGAADRAAAAAAAGVLGRQGRGRRAYALARAGESGGARRARGVRLSIRRAVARWRTAGVRDRVLVWNVRAQPDRRSGRRVLRELRRTADRRVRRRGRGSGTHCRARGCALVHAGGVARGRGGFAGVAWGGGRRSGAGCPGPSRLLDAAGRGRGAGGARRRRVAGSRSSCSAPARPRRLRRGCGSRS